MFGEAFTRLSARGTDEIVAISNAAVVGPVGPVDAADPIRVESHLDTNVVSAVLFARAFVAAFQQHDCPKTFVNVSSGAATHGQAGLSLYCASKAAMENFVRSLALEQSARSRPIVAVNVNPGTMDTLMQAEVRTANVEDLPDRERYAALEREGRLGQPPVVAARIADLVSSRPRSGALYAMGV